MTKEGMLLEGKVRSDSGLVFCCHRTQLYVGCCVVDWVCAFFVQGREPTHDKDGALLEGKLGLRLSAFLSAGWLAGWLVCVCVRIGVCYYVDGVCSLQHG